MNIPENLKYAKTMNGLGRGRICFIGISDLHNQN